MNLLNPFFRRSQIDRPTARQLAEHAHHATLIYCSPEIGGLEFRCFQHLFAEYELPQPAVVHGLRGLMARSLRQRWGALWQRILRREPPPHPVRSGQLRRLVASGQSAWIQLKSTALYDDRFWDLPEEDPLLAVIQAQHDGLRPCLLIPLQFLWGRYPERGTKGLLDILLGEPYQPRFLRKLWLLGRHYFQGPVIQIGTPIELPALLAAHAAEPDAHTARALREQLLGAIQQKRRGSIGPALKPRAWMCEQLLQSEALQRVIYDTARERHRPVEDVQLLATQYLVEIASNMNLTVLELVYRLMRWVFSHIYDGVVVDEEGMARLRSAMERGPVVLVPSHRSHIDYLILSVLLYERQLALPHVASGNNLAFWPLGPIIRRCGSFFLRRSFGGNALYKAAFTAYLQFLISEGHCLEFFIEGGRSRTGKALMPRFGMLAMLGQALRAGAAETLRFLPVAITYDQVIEQGAFISEIHGGQKTKESGFGLLRLGKYLRRRYGRIYLRFGPELDYLSCLQQVAGEHAQVASMSDAERHHATPLVARTIMREINRAFIITPSALVATALLVHRSRAMTEAELHEITSRLLHFLRWKESPVSELLHLDPPRAIQEALHHFIEGRLILRHAEFAPNCYEVDRARRVALDIRKNTIVHSVVSMSCLAVILRSHFLAGHIPISRELVTSDFQRCQQLFQQEFTFATRLPLAEHLERLLGYLQQQGWIELVGHGIQLQYAGAGQLWLFAVLLRNYFEAYKASFLGAQQIATTGIEARNLLRQSLRYGQHLLLLGGIRCPEAVSQITFHNAIQTWIQLGLLAPEATKSQGRHGPALCWQPQHPLAAIFQAKLEEWC